MATKITRVQLIVTVEQDGVSRDTISIDQKRPEGFENDFVLSFNKPLVPLIDEKTLETVGHIQKGPMSIQMTLLDFSGDGEKLYWNSKPQQPEQG